MLMRITNAGLSDHGKEGWDHLEQERQLCQNKPCHVLVKLPVLILSQLVHALEAAFVSCSKIESGHQHWIEQPQGRERV